MYNGILDRHDLLAFGFDAGRFKKLNRGLEWHGPCPWCGGEDRLLIKNGTYWCRQCSRAGTLVSLLEEPPTEEEVRRSEEAARIKREAEEREWKAEKERKLREFNRTRPWETFHRNLMERSDIQHVLARDGIEMEEIKHFKLGFAPFFRFTIDGHAFNGPGLVFPIPGEKRMYNLRIRLLDRNDLPGSPIENIEGDKYRPFISGIGASYLRADYPGTDWIVVVEGEKKAIVAWKHKIPAIGLQGAFTFKEEWAAPLKKRYRHIYIALDPDESGQAGARRLANLLGGINILLEGKPDDLLNDGRMTVSQFIQKLSESHFGGK